MPEDEVRKAQVNKETVAAVFFDVEKAYDMLWREGLLIKLHQMGLGRTEEYIIRKLPKSVRDVERCATEWGFKFSVEKTKFMVFTNKVRERTNFKLHGKNLERGRVFSVWACILIQD